MGTNKAKNLSGASASQKSARSSQGSNAEDGVGNTKLIEPIPEYLAASCEKVIKGENNTWIVLGRDRPGTRSSGRGGAGESHAGSIDLVVGRLGSKAKTVDKKGNKIYADPDFVKDASRIIISQKTDIDKNMNLSPGKVGESEAKAAIALKSDDIRICARQGIKLVTVVDSENAQGGKAKDNGNVGVDLMGGNCKTKDMQPMVLGDKLKDYLLLVNKEIAKLNGIIAGYVEYQMMVNTAFIQHYHITIFPIMPTSPSFNAIPLTLDNMTKHLTRTGRSLVNQRHNIKTLSTNNLSKTNKNGKKNPGYILSAWHHLN